MTSTDVLAARGGDAEAFARLVHEHAGPVCAITTAILGSPVAGEEVAQEVFVCAWQGLAALQDPARFGAWIRGIARNRARDSLRTRLHRREVAEDALNQLSDTAPDPGERLDGAAEEATLWAALEALDQDHREVLVLFYREGCSVEQVARQLELTEPTVRKRLSRARERLRGGVEERLGQRLTRPQARTVALVAAVGAAIALAPGSARAAVGGASLVPSKLSLATAGALLAAVAMIGTCADLHHELPEVSPPSATLGSLVVPELGHLPERPAAPDAVPDHVVHAFLAAEDARFYEHGPVDVQAIGRAVLHNAAGGDLQGGSTLTQQLAKRLLLERMPDRSLRRKASEVLMAVELERQLTKDQILTLYLDDVYLGAGAFGLVDAARVYFDEPVGALTLAEGALLAGIPAHPQANNPFDDPDGALKRRSQVLARMEANGWASASEVAAAEATPLPQR